VDSLQSSYSRQFRRNALLTSGAAFVITFVLWNFEPLSFLLYPLRLFVTFVHESGHGLAAILTGGGLDSFVVNSNGSGYARTFGGNLAFILPAGYLGAAFFGALLFYLTNTVRHTKVIAFTLGAGLIFITLLYTWRSPIALLVGLASGALLILLALRGGRVLTLLVLNTLAVLTSLNAVLDLVGLLGNTDASLGAIRNDAAAFSAAIAPLVPPVVWVVLWAGIAIVALGAAFYYSIVHPLTRKVDQWNP
jgi:hypothetical protein